MEIEEEEQKVTEEFCRASGAELLKVLGKMHHLYVDLPRGYEDVRILSKLLRDLMDQYFRCGIFSSVEFGLGDLVLLQKVLPVSRVSDPVPPVLVDASM